MVALFHQPDPSRLKVVQLSPTFCLVLVPMQNCECRQIESLLQTTLFNGGPSCVNRSSIRGEAEVAFSKHEQLLLWRINEPTSCIMTPPMTCTWTTFQEEVQSVLQGEGAGF